MTTSRHYLPCLVLAVTALLTACEPYDFHYAPAVAGRVVSATTNRSVAGAAVSMSAENQSERTHTDQDGRFMLPRLHHLGILTLSEGYVGGIGVLRVEAHGYRTYNEQNIGGPSPFYESGKNSGSDDAHSSPDWEHIHIKLTPGV